MGTIASVKPSSATSLPLGPSESRAAQGLKMGLGIYDYLQDSTDKYGPAFTIQPPGLDPMVWVSDVDMVKDFFALKPEQYDQSKVPIPIDFGKDAIGFINDQFHADTRKIMLKPLAAKPVTDRADVMLELITRGINNLEVGEEYDLTRIVGSITLDIATYTLIGETQGARFERYRELVLKWMYESCKDSMFFIGTMYGPEKFRNWLTKKYKSKSKKGDFGSLKKGFMPWSYAVELKATLADMIRKDVRETRTNNDTERDDVLTRMAFATYSDGTELSEEKIISEVLALFIAGYETSAATGGWFGIWLQKNPDINQKIREEVANSIAEEGRLNPHTIADNKYISACLNESQRLTPSAVGTMRHLKYDTKIGSITLPAGTNVLANAYIVHRNRRVWGDDALNYRPERWLEVDCRPKPYEFFPFGGGRRACLGSGQARQQLRILFSEFARRVEFTSKFDNNNKWPGQQQAGGQTVPKGGVPVKVKSIKPF
ncbi:MAG: cytochrome P450 [Pseudomonadales bacterium]|nr:cytochrome P450 [Pseudomonadales bacterium]